MHVVTSAREEYLRTANATAVKERRKRILSSTEELCKHAHRVASETLY